MDNEIPNIEVSSTIQHAEKEDSLGIIDMSGVRAFGESASTLGLKRTTNDVLQAKRRQALETLNKLANNSEYLQKSYEMPLKNSSMKSPVTDIQRTPGLDRTDYVPYRKTDTINITDLIAESTINLESTDHGTSSSVPKSSISFEPAEFTGRSTLHHAGLSKPSKTELPSVEQILASSFAPNIRSLCDSLRESSIGVEGSFSLPRTADMSRSSQAGSMSFSFSNQPRNNESGFSSEEFAPAELMESKLLRDEESWAQQFATIPAAVNESVMSKKEATLSIGNQNQFDPDFSLGAYFDKRSENLFNMVSSYSPKKTRAPVALIDDTQDISITPKPDNKTYSAYIRPSLKISSTFSADEKNSESKDSGNASENSYLLSTSAIERVLNDLAIHSEDSNASIVNRLLMAKKTKSCMNPYREPSVEPASLETKSRRKMLSLDGEFLRPAPPKPVQPLVENKENHDPKLSLSSTLSFTDSLLDCSDMKKLDGSRRDSQRMPLSPIDITVHDDDADVEEHQISPVKTPSKRIRRARSRSKSPNPVRMPEQHTTTNESSKKPKSRPKSSTLVNETDEDVQFSPNFSKSQFRSNQAARSPSPAVYDSPASSPRSCISSNVSSPRLETTTASDRRFLVGGIGRGGASSPDCGKMSLPSYGLVHRTSSTASLKSRSGSQCSNSSEFSHRDGRVIPLKVTCYELSWGSTKLRTNSKKTMQIKNTSAKRLVIRVEVSGPGFQVVSFQSNLITLQSQECRTIDIIFCPTVIGAAVGTITFSSPRDTSAPPFLEIPLYGYGGHTSLIPQGIQKGPVGSAFITMGDLRELSAPLEHTFSIFNKGPLHGFAIVIVDSIGLDLPRLWECIEVEPKKLIIPPQGTATIRVTFKPRRDDIKKIIKKISNVLTLANLRIITGDEPTRQRLRNLIRQMNESDKSKISSNSLDQVWKVLKDERVYPDLVTLKERSNVSFDLVSTLRIHEVALTLNHSSLDDTTQSTLVFPDADETIVFRTILANSPTETLEPVDELDEDDAEAVREEGSWSVRPNVLVVQPAVNTTFLIKSNFKTNQYFKVASNFKHLLSVTPNEGHLAPGDQVQISVFVTKQAAFLPNEKIQINVQVQGEMITIPVKLMTDLYPVKFK